jgi:signal transduction histidine kinase
MKKSNFPYLIFFVSAIVLLAIALQVYWNAKSYQQNKQRLTTDVQICLDNALEQYYKNLSKTDYITFFSNSKTKDANFMDKINLDTVFEKQLKRVRKIAGSNKKKVLLNSKTSIKIVSKNNIDSQLQSAEIKPSQINNIKVIKGNNPTVSLYLLRNFANRIVISMTRDSLNFINLSKNINDELQRKKINVSFQLEHLKQGKTFQKFPEKANFKNLIPTNSNTLYLPKGETLKIYFSNPTTLILRRSATGILLSFLLSFSLIFCLFYLLKIINKQKKLDEIKNDLISNITHEFKTPITTISTAIEGIKSFNHENDLEKTNRYLDISQQQLGKLQTMVEKILETATLETDALKLNLEPTNMVQLLSNLIFNHKMNNREKNITFDCGLIKKVIKIDVFHFENAISNLIDNALKYGGKNIVVAFAELPNELQISVSDDGDGISKSNQSKVFEKFYRIPKGDVHDVKGFGIGLFYAKKIIEKHQGSITLSSQNNYTTFLISIPNES